MLPKFTVVCFFSTTSWSLGDVPLSPISLNPCSKLGDGLPKPQKLSWKKFRWRESELDTPVMLTGSAMHKWWKKKKHWAPREIKRVAVRRNKTLKGVRVKTGSQELLFGNPTRAVKRLDHELLDMDPTTFFSDLMDTPKLRRESKTLYYTSHINSSVAPQLLFPKSVRSVICRAFFYPPCDRVERYMTWISSAGAVARLHLDFPHNLYLHAHGTKTMVLLHPKIHRKLRLHPRWHPSSRQSQLSCGQLQEAFGEDGLESDYGFRVIMRPGDVLYLPPMWFHMAEVGEAGPAVSVNVWMGSDESRAVYTLYNDTVHDGLIPKGTDMRATFLVARKYIDALLKAIYKDDHGSVVLRHLDERYWPEAPWKSRHRFHESRMYRRGLCMSKFVIRRTQSFCHVCCIAIKISRKNLQRHRGPAVG